MRSRNMFKMLNYKKIFGKELKKNNNIKLSCCFSGHRPQKLPWGFNEDDERCVKMRNSAKVEIESAIKRGYNTFYCGMALGFDMMCAEIVLELKKKYSYIKLIGAIPFKNQTERWVNKVQIDRYMKILKQLDESRCVYDKYQEGCMQERNKFMINNSTLVIALFNGRNGGTKFTLDYARELDKEIIIITP